jgi:ABC-type multidrug transport system fused ATPase/permease subunit
MTVKLISKNTELIILLLIIFYIFVVLTVMYESKINKLESDLGKEQTCVSENSLYFSHDNNGYYKVSVMFKEKIAEGYAKISYLGNDLILQLDPSLVNNLYRGYTYSFTIEDISNIRVIKNDLQNLINNNKIIAVKQEI